MHANIRIQWIHKRLSENSYPNCNHLADRFSISHRQAQRDIDYLRDQLGAPICYDSSRKGFYYSGPYTLPFLFASSSDSYVSGAEEDITVDNAFSDNGSMVQMQIPYSATLEITDRLTPLELSRFIIDKVSLTKYICEFRNVEQFMASIFAASAAVKVLEPAWLREKIITAAKDLLIANEN